MANGPYSKGMDVQTHTPSSKKHILGLIGESNSVVNYGVQVRVLQYEAKVYATLCRKLTYRSAIWTRAESARQCVREY